LSTLDPNLDEAITNPAEIMVRLRHKLMEPRHRLSVKVNDFELIPQNDLPGGVDAKNGPQPQRCDISQLTGNTFLLTYRIVAYYWEGKNLSILSGTFGKRAVDETGNAVLFNRWTETVDLDASGRDGKFVIRSDNNKGVIADQVRSQMAALSLPKGFIRDSSQYRETADGLAIEYRIVDKEVFKLPPFTNDQGTPFEAEGEYTESTPRGGVLRTVAVRVALRGSRNTDQLKLVQTAIAVAARKLEINGAPLTGPDASLLESGSVQVKLFDCKVEVQLRALVNPPSPGTPSRTLWGYVQGAFTLGFAGRPDTPATPRFMGLPLIPSPAMVETPYSDENPQPPPYRLRGSAGYLLIAARYYDPSLQNTKLNTDGQLSEGGPQVGKGGVTP